MDSRYTRGLIESMVFGQSERAFIHISDGGPVDSKEINKTDLDKLLDTHMIQMTIQKTNC